MKHKIFVAKRNVHNSLLNKNYMPLCHCWKYMSFKKEINQKKRSEKKKQKCIRKGSVESVIHNLISWIIKMARAGCYRVQIETIMIIYRSEDRWKKNIFLINPQYCFLCKQTNKQNHVLKKMETKFKNKGERKESTS